MILTTDGGLRLEAPTAKGIVAQMRRLGWNAPARKPEYMRLAARRALEVTGQPVRHDSPETFIADLVSAGLLTPEPDFSLD